ncbi:MAG TPA: hypothetical protein VD994_12665 [Prosthecobacter sp.]|nr:hypothetical protein [Prosthecobacter sp.]
MTGGVGIWGTILAALRANRLPCVLLNVVVVALVWSYYQWPQAAAMWEAVAEFRLRWSYGFSFFATILAAAVLPTGIQWLFGTLPPRGRLKRLVSLTVFWGYRGMEIDLLYRCQALLFGQGNDARTLAAKVAVDQFVYSALWAVPTYAVALRFIALGNSWRRTRESLGRKFWTRTYPTILVTNWLIWIPTVALVYSLPGPLQFPLFSVVMCFFVLIVTLLAGVREREE